jgi:hypothetical protein
LKQFPLQSVEGRAEQPLDRGAADPRAERDGDVEQEARQCGRVEGPLAHRLDALLESQQALEAGGLGGARTQAGCGIVGAPDLLSNLRELLRLAGSDLAPEARGSRVAMAKGAESAFL